MAVKLIVNEPKWMVGIEWDMINIIRDIYGRLVLGQYFQPGGQGLAVQQSRDPNDNSRFEQSKVVDKPLQGGGILVIPTDLPKRVLTEIGISYDDILTLDKSLTDKRSAKDQVRCICYIHASFLVHFIQQVLNHFYHRNIRRTSFVTF